MDRRTVGYIVGSNTIPSMKFTLTLRQGGQEDGRVDNFGQFYRALFMGRRSCSAAPPSAPCFPFAVEHKRSGAGVETEWSRSGAAPERTLRQRDDYYR